MKLETDFVMRLFKYKDIFKVRRQYMESVNLCYSQISIRLIR